MVRDFRVRRFHATQIIAGLQPWVAGLSLSRFDGFEEVCQRLLQRWKLVGSQPIAESAAQHAKPCGFTGGIHRWGGGVSRLLEMKEPGAVSELRLLVFSSTVMLLVPR